VWILIKLYIATILAHFLPRTRAFNLKRTLYNWAGVHLGKNVRMHSAVLFESTNVIVGENSWIGSQVVLIPSNSAEICIGSNCDIAPGCLFVVGTHELGTPLRRAGTGKSLPIFIGNGTWIGAKTTILGGVSIGNGVVIAAGSLVRTDIPSNTLFAGVPAKFVRKLDT
jgi:maltose O-acetyltransferase